MTPQKLALEPFTAGDTWRGIPSITITVNGAPPSSALASVRMRFTPVSNPDATAVELTSAAAKITISSAANWVVVVPKQAVPALVAGRWDWQLKFTDATGTVTTYLADSINVLPTV